MHLINYPVQYVHQYLMLLFVISELILASCCCTAPYLYNPYLISSIRVYSRCWQVLESIRRLWLGASCNRDQNEWSQLFFISPSVQQSTFK